MLGKTHKAEQKLDLFATIETEGPSLCDIIYLL